jgi:hypothetical protein
MRALPQASAVGGCLTPLGRAWRSEARSGPPDAVGRAWRWSRGRGSRTPSGGRGAGAATPARVRGSEFGPGRQAVVVRHGGRRDLDAARKALSDRNARGLRRSGHDARRWRCIESDAGPAVVERSPRPPELSSHRTAFLGRRRQAPVTARPHRGRAATARLT